VLISRQMKINLSNSASPPAADQPFRAGLETVRGHPQKIPTNNAVEPQNALHQLTIVFIIHFGRSSSYTRSFSLKCWGKCLAYLLDCHRGGISRPTSHPTLLVCVFPSENSCDIAVLGQTREWKFYRTGFPRFAYIAAVVLSCTAVLVGYIVWTPISVLIIV
jgi:hypothetical protein